MNKTTKIVIGILILLLTIFIIFNFINNKKINNLKNSNNNLSVLTDSVKYYTNKIGQITAEKESFTGSIKEIKKLNNKLSKNQKELINKISILENKNSLISASNILLNVTVDSLTNNRPIYDTNNNTVTFKDSLKDIQYNVLFKLKEPELKLNYLKFSNSQFISYKYSKDKTKVLVSVTNSNKYFTVANVDSYIIPLKQKKPLIKVIGVGVGIGLIGGYLLFK